MRVTLYVCASTKKKVSRHLHSAQHTVHGTHSARRTQCTTRTVHSTHSAQHTQGARHAQYTAHTVHSAHSAQHAQCTAHTVHGTHSARHTGCTAASEASDQHLCVCFTPPVSSNLLCTLYTRPLLSETKIDPIATCVFVTSLLLCHPLHKFGDSSLNQMIFNIICPSTSPQLTDQPLE